MRLGCGGCLVGLAILVGLTSGAMLIGHRGLQEPVVRVDLPSPDDGLRGQQKIFTVFRGGAGRARGRTAEVLLSEREINGFLTRHLAETAELPLTAGAIKLLGDGKVEFKGRLPLRHILPQPAHLLPAAWLDRPVWLHLQARASLETEAVRGHRRYLRLDVERYAIGRQRVPGVVVRPLLSRAVLGLLRWPLPDTVEAITIESQKAVIVIRTVS